MQSSMSTHYPKLQPSPPHHFEPNHLLFTNSQESNQHSNKTHKSSVVPHYVNTPENNNACNYSRPQQYHPQPPPTSNFLHTATHSQKSNDLYTTSYSHTGNSNNHAQNDQFDGGVSLQHNIMNTAPSAQLYSHNSVANYLVPHNNTQFISNFAQASPQMNLVPPCPQFIQQPSSSMIIIQQDPGLSTNSNYYNKTNNIPPTNQQLVYDAQQNPTLLSMDASSTTSTAPFQWSSSIGSFGYTSSDIPSISSDLFSHSTQQQPFYFANMTTAQQAPTIYNQQQHCHPQSNSLDIYSSHDLHAGFNNTVIALPQSSLPPQQCNTSPQPFGGLIVPYSPLQQELQSNDLFRQNHNNTGYNVINNSTIRNSNSNNNLIPTFSHLQQSSQYRPLIIDSRTPITSNNISNSTLTSTTILFPLSTHSLVQPITVQSFDSPSAPQDTIFEEGNYTYINDETPYIFSLQDFSPTPTIPVPITLATLRALSVHPPHSFVALGWCNVTTAVFRLVVSVREVFEIRTDYSTIHTLLSDTTSCLDFAFPADFAPLFVQGAVIEVIADAQSIFTRALHPSARVRELLPPQVSHTRIAQPLPHEIASHIHSDSPSFFREFCAKSPNPTLPEAQHPAPITSMSLQSVYSELEYKVYPTPTKSCPGQRRVGFKAFNFAPNLLYHSIEIVGLRLTTNHQSCTSCAPERNCCRIFLGDTTPIPGPKYPVCIPSYNSIMPKSCSNGAIVRVRAIIRACDNGDIALEAQDIAIIVALNHKKLHPLIETDTNDHSLVAYHRACNVSIVTVERENEYNAQRTAILSTLAKWSQNIPHTFAAYKKHFEQTWPLSYLCEQFPSYYLPIYKNLTLLPPTWPDIVKKALAVGNNSNNYNNIHVNNNNNNNNHNHHNHSHNYHNNNINYHNNGINSVNNNNINRSKFTNNYKGALVKPQETTPPNSNHSYPVHIAKSRHNTPQRCSEQSFIPSQTHSISSSLHKSAKNSHNHSVAASKQ